MGVSICESEEAFQQPDLPCGALGKSRFLKCGKSNHLRSRDRILLNRWRREEAAFEQRNPNAVETAQCLFTEQCLGGVL
jgi:hypothetical protein